MTGVPKGDEKAVDIGALLTIDVDAELRKLATAQLQGPWQIPAELVRRSMAAGASRVDVSFSRRRVRVEDDGRVIDVAQAQALSEDEQWQEMYHRLRAWSREHGNCNPRRNWKAKIDAEEKGKCVHDVLIIFVHVMCHVN